MKANQPRLPRTRQLGGNESNSKDLSRSCAKRVENVGKVFEGSEGDKNALSRQPVPHTPPPSPPPLSVFHSPSSALLQLIGHLEKIFKVVKFVEKFGKVLNAGYSYLKDNQITRVSIKF